MSYRILSLDGGGVRGLLSAQILLELEKRIGKPLSQVFDLIAGTSTGAIEACLLAYGYSAQDIVSFYTEDPVKTIFKPYVFSIFRKSKYNTNNINNVLNEKLRNKRLRDLSTNILIPTYDLKSRNTLLFSNLDYIYKNLFLKDIVIASASAPSYFTPHEFDEYRCIDGGISANNPSMCAYSLVKAMYPDKEIIIVSLGTGSFEHEVSYNEMCLNKPISLISNIIDCFMDGNSDTVELEAQRILKNNYLRFQLTLPKENSDIDNISSKNLTQLQDLAINYLNNEWKDKFDKVVDLLIEQEPQ